MSIHDIQIQCIDLFTFFKIQGWIQSICPNVDLFTFIMYKYRGYSRFPNMDLITFSKYSKSQDMDLFQVV